MQDFGADVLLPVKFFGSDCRRPNGALLTLLLAARLPFDKAKEMTKTLLELGASLAQAVHQITALHFVSGAKPELLETLFALDEPAAKRAINHLGVSGNQWSPSAQSPLMFAIRKGDSEAAMKLLEAGASPDIEFTDWVKAVQVEFEEVKQEGHKQNHDRYLRDIQPPVIEALNNELPDVVLALLRLGADPNALSQQVQVAILSDWQRSSTRMESLLDMVRRKIKALQDYDTEPAPKMPDYKLKDPNRDYLSGVVPGTYREFVQRKQLEWARFSDEKDREAYKKALEKHHKRRGIAEKAAAIKELLHKFKDVEAELVVRRAKTFRDLFPDIEDEYREYIPRHGEETKDWNVSFDFRVPELTADLRDAYLWM